MKSATELPKPFFISIIPNFPGSEEYLAGLIRGRYAETGIEYFAMSYPLHPQGDDLYDKVGIQKASFRKLKELLKDEEGIRLGILFQSTIGHGGYWNLTPRCGLEADHIVKADGTVTHRCCPLDSRFLDYIERCVTLLCEERPDFTLGDDDMRMFDGTCYCERHVKLVSEMTGRAFTRESLAAAVAEAGPHDPVAAAFEKAQIEAMRRLCETVRRAIDSVDPAIPCGCCIVGGRCDYVETETRTLAGKTEPFLRIGNASYLEGALRDAIWRDALTGCQTAWFKNKGFKLLDESDTCPHNRYSKSARTMHAHITAGLLRGLDGGKLWLDQGAHPLRDISRPYEKILAENQYFYRRVLETARGWRPEGCAVFVPGMERDPFPARGLSFFENCDWSTFCFGRVGIPVRYEAELTPGIHLLNGGQIDFYTDEELKKLLSGPVLADGPAAVKLTERGFAGLTGVRAEMKPVRGSREVLKGSGVSMGFLAAGGTPFLTLMPGAEELSEVFFSQFAGGASEKTMPGSSFFANALGGKVIVTAMNLREWHQMHVANPGRKLMYVSWLEKLGGVPCYVPEMQDARVICGTLPDGAPVCAVFNSSYDPLPVRIAAAKRPRQVLRLTPEGAWEEGAFRIAGGTVETPWILEPGQVGICKLI